MYTVHVIYSFLQSVFIFATYASDPAPQCPTKVKAVSVGCGLVNVSWYQPTPPIAVMTTVRCCLVSSPHCDNSTTCTGPGSNCTVDKLKPKTKYAFTVIAAHNCVAEWNCSGNTVTNVTGQGMSVSGACVGIDVVTCEYTQWYMEGSNIP